MIPANITRAHLLRAIAEIDGAPIPPHQQSTRYDVVHEGKRYPPKLVVRTANRLANGEELWDFGGGKETNQFLERLGFTILLKSEHLTPQEELTIEYNEWVLTRLLEYRQTHPEFYFLTRTNKSEDRLEMGHWFPGSDYLHIGLTRSASGDHSTKSVGFKIDCSWEGHPRAFFVVLFKQERDPAVLRFYRALLDELTPYGMREENHDCFILPYGEDIAAALQLFLHRDVPIFRKLLKKHGLEDRLGVSRASFENKLNNVLGIRGTSGRDNPEYRLARLCWNDNGWVSPSGRGGKSPDKTSFECEYGFGFEEWLFDFDKVLDDGYHYGFLQPVNQEWQAYSGKRYNIRLYARDGESGQRYWIGELAPVEVIDRPQSEAVETAYREKGWIKEMERQLTDLSLDPEVLDARRPEVVGAMFNIRFLPKDAYIYKEPIPFSGEEADNMRSNRYRFLKFKGEPPADVPTHSAFTFRSSAPDISPAGTISRKLESRVVELPDKHKQIQQGLYQWLVDRHGAEQVAHEQPTGAGGARIDLAVQLAPDNLIFYEIKTYPSLMAGIRVALGQLMEYAYFPEGCRARQLVIVSYHKPDPVVLQYLENLRTRTGLPVYYGYFDLEEAKLVM